MKISWWEWLPFWRWRVIGEAGSADEVPDHLPRNAVAIVADAGRTKWVIFDCPCRTGHRIMLNADSSRRPHWTLNPAQRLTISPSIDYRGSKRHCHYFIRNGRIEWAKDSDR